MKIQVLLSLLVMFVIGSAVAETANAGPIVRGIRAVGRGVGRLVHPFRCRRGCCLNDCQKAINLV